LTRRNAVCILIRRCSGAEPRSELIHTSFFYPPAAILVPSEPVLKVKLQADFLDHVRCGFLSNPAQVKQVGANLFGKTFE
jgi:hypothetical protein